MTKNIVHNCDVMKVSHSWDVLTSSIYMGSNLLIHRPPLPLLLIYFFQPDWVPLNPIKWDINSFCMLPQLAGTQFWCPIPSLWSSSWSSSWFPSWCSSFIHNNDLYCVPIIDASWLPSLWSSSWFPSCSSSCIYHHDLHHDFHHYLHRVSIIIINFPMANFMVPPRPGRQISRSSSATINTEFHNYYPHHQHGTL